MRTKTRKVSNGCVNPVCRFADVRTMSQILKATLGWLFLFLRNRALKLNAFGASFNHSPYSVDNVISVVIDKLFGERGLEKLVVVFHLLVVGNCQMCPS